MPIIQRLSALFKTPAPEVPKPLPPMDALHLIGALLVRVAKADRHYAFQEISQIDRILTRLEGLGPIEAAKLRGECERLEAFAPDTDDFALMLCSMVDYETRFRVTEALWEIVYADGTTEHTEIEMMEITQQHLGIPPGDCAAARAQAKAALSPDA